MTFKSEDVKGITHKLIHEYGEIFMHEITDETNTHFSICIHPDTMYIEWFDTLLHHHGCGRLMFLDLEELARSRNVQYLQLNSLIESIGFWEKMGFTEVQEDNDDYPTMIKKIN
jgi:hypothetical protein